MSHATCNFQVKKNIAEVFNRSAAAYDRVGPRFFTHFGCRLVELAEIRPAFQILDVATGRGAILFPAAKQIGTEGRGIGIDFSEGMIRGTLSTIKQKGLSNIEIQKMDGEHLGFIKAVFDIVFCGFAIFFFPHPKKALREFFRVLKPKGLLAVAAFARNPHADWVENVIKTYVPVQNFQARSSGETYMFDTPDEMTTMLIKERFQRIRVIQEELDLIYIDEDEWWNQQWSHGMRELLEQIESTRRRTLKHELFQHLAKYKQPDGIHIPMRVLFALGTKS